MRTEMRNRLSMMGEKAMTTPPRSRDEILNLSRETTLYEWTAQKTIKPMVIDRAEGI